MSVIGARWFPRLITSLLVLEFLSISSWYLFVFFFVDQGIDARIYHRALEAWLDGGNPWTANYNGVAFGAPPWTLLYLLPGHLLPENGFVTLSIVGSVAAAVYVLHRLKLPPWWLFFPPLVEAVTTANPNVMMIALLVRAATWTDAIAGLAKVYALVPVAILGRWRSLAAFALVSIATAAFLPWGSYFEQREYIAGLFRDQTGGGKSALGFWPLVPPVALALVYLGRQRSAWLAVPALWPGTQFQASVIALPAIRHPILAGTFALPFAFAAPIGVVLFALWTWLRRRREPDATRPEDWPYAVEAVPASS